MQDDQDLRAKLEAAIAQGQQLRDEAQQLKAILVQHSIPLTPPGRFPIHARRCRDG